MRGRTALVAGLLIALAGCSSAPDPPDRTAQVAEVATPGAPAAPPAIVGDAPTRTYSVARREDTWTRDGGRTLRTRSWYPTASGTFPVVLFSHGLGGRPEDFDPLLTRWAAAGFVIVAPAYPKTRRGAAEFDIGDVPNQPADASYVLTQALAGPLRARMDADRVAAAGHSAGGITTVGLFTDGRDPRLRAGVVLAGSSLGVGRTFTGDPATLLYVHGEADATVRYAAGRDTFDRTPWSKAMLTVRGGGHSEFLHPDGAAYPAVAATTLDFLRWALYGDPAARDRLSGDARGNPLDVRL